MPDEVRNDYAYWELRLRSATQTLQSEWPKYPATTDPTDHLRLRTQLIAALDEREALQDAANQVLAKDFSAAFLDSQLKSAPIDVRADLAKSIQKAQQTGQQEVVQQATQLFDSGDIQQSPYVYYVASADEKKWAPKFDQTAGRGTFGNTDIAIKALAPGNFTIKGISFNPADVAATASKVTSQTVLLAAQVAGVPGQALRIAPAGRRGWSPRAKLTSIEYRPLRQHPSGCANRRTTRGATRHRRGGGQ